MKKHEWTTPLGGKMKEFLEREYLWEAGISHSGHGPRIHDLRHTFCVHCLKRWVLSGKDILNLMPYLSAYLGHADFQRDTVLSSAYRRPLP